MAGTRRGGLGSTTLQPSAGVGVNTGFNSDPYYNEAGYERQVGTPQGAANSKLYNENALLLSLKTIATTLSRPPIPFGELTRLHFAHHGPSILRSIHVILDAATAVEGTAPSAELVAATKRWNIPCPPSSGFIHLFRKLAERLEVTLQGADATKTTEPS
eukprot:CAMPEP_0175884122 /NCGR_PEP_ID=MMETSP0107_2-20121207/44351_1 /TAXON_ID=195067 ORGANISM="Goniomonas pacifica, Strain CCMP1869" /NCGR_SAMPLE_ID=MMETSP0107_2 /ASSEMBLY_ACC=CAM_ASM_000203 /LENGTH=158 /DNA_ID=CAMNT_0017204249 /DNA_START=73 /DNA_END=549 /DNA_ORIENTATION=+